MCSAVAKERSKEVRGITLATTHEKRQLFITFLSLLGLGRLGWPETAYTHILVSVFVRHTFVYQRLRRVASCTSPRKKTCSRTHKSQRDESRELLRETYRMMGRAASASAMLMKMSHSVCSPPHTRCQRAAPLVHASSSIAGKGMAEAGRSASSTPRSTYLSTLSSIRAHFLCGKHKTPHCKRGQAGAGRVDKAKQGASSALIEVAKTDHMRGSQLVVIFAGLNPHKAKFVGEGRLHLRVRGCVLVRHLGCCA